MKIILYNYLYNHKKHHSLYKEAVTPRTRMGVGFFCVTIVLRTNAPHTIYKNYNVF